MKINQKDFLVLIPMSITMLLVGLAIWYNPWSKVDVDVSPWTGLSLVWDALYENYLSNSGSVWQDDLDIPDILSGDSSTNTGVISPFVLEDNVDWNCNLLLSGWYKELQLNQNIWRTPSLEDINNGNFDTAEAIIKVDWTIEEAYICLIADLDPIDKKLSTGRRNSVYFIVNWWSQWGHINTSRESVSPSVVWWEWVFLSQEAPEKYFFSLSGLVVANTKTEWVWSKEVSPIEEFNRNQQYQKKIISFVSKYDWWRINTIKIFYKWWEIQRVWWY